MPKDFDKCAASGGKVVTKKLKDDKYIHLCKTKSDKWTSGKVKQKNETLTFIDDFNSIYKYIMQN